MNNQKAKEEAKKLVQISGFSNYYCDKEGNIYSKWQKLKYGIRNGYPSVSLRRNNKSFSKSIHRIVAKHFISNPENKPEVNHIDGDKTNNNISNLEWCTRKENNDHAIKTGLVPKAILNRSDLSIPVNQYKNGKLINTYLSMHDALRQTGISVRWISACCKGGYFATKNGKRKWLNCRSAGGYQWEQVKEEIKKL